MTSRVKNDFSKGSVVKTIISLAIPMTVAQLINVLYNIIDRVYIGRMGQDATLSLTGLGIAFPVISMVTAFSNLFGMGGAPLCSIARGRGDLKEAKRIMGNSFTMLLISGVVLTVFGLAFRKPMLYLLGASDATYPFARDYTSIYLIGTIFVMIGLGMNGFINSQGFAKMGMMSVVLGAVMNLILDPIFIFGLHMGVKGAAAATVISQFASCMWVMRFLTGKKTILKLDLKAMKLSGKLVGKITSLGMSSFIMSVTNSGVQMVCNSALQIWGGDIYIGAMTVINSVREMATMPVLGMTNSAQPFIGYNYGAGCWGRVKKSIIFISAVCISYTVGAWAILHAFPEFFIKIFNTDPELIAIGVRAMRIYFFGFFMMSLQFSGQSVFVALGKSKQAIFFSLLRKAVIVIPLTLILPRFFGTDGVFIAEPVSNFIGGSASFITMIVIVGKELKGKERLSMGDSRI